MLQVRLPLSSLFHLQLLTTSFTVDAKDKAASVTGMKADEAKGKAAELEGKAKGKAEEIKGKM